MAIKEYYTRMKKIKRSAIHNLVVTSCEPEGRNGVFEGLIVPSGILDRADIIHYEQIIVTKISGNNWINRIKTFVIEGNQNGEVIACGSLASFFQENDITCIISETALNETNQEDYLSGRIPLFDLGFDPDLNKDNTIDSKLNIEFINEKINDVSDFKVFRDLRIDLPRFVLDSIIIGLKVTETHPDCLQGSAELPEEIMKEVDLQRYQSVSVYNMSRGGMADTYAVPMPPGIVMTTGAMAKFAVENEIVSVATFILTGKNKIEPKFYTHKSK